jgi:hypothetical protein
MATALFITRTDLVKNSIINGAVDTNKFIQFIKIAQEIHIQNYLGSSLYDKISSDITGGTLAGDYETLVEDFIKPMLIHFAMVDYLPFAAYQVNEGGIVKYLPENAESVQKSEVDYLIDKHRGFAQFYTRRMVDYILFNQSKYPEYNDNKQDDMFPDTDANFTGWVL